jgi:hypothetical protein
MKKKELKVGKFFLPSGKISLLCLAGAFLSFLALQTGCMQGLAGALQETNQEIRNAVDTFDRAIDALARQSADWQVVLQNLEASMTENVQSTIRVEVTNLLQTGVLASGGEFRCNAEYLRLRTERKLIQIRNRLAETLNDAGLRPPIPLLPEIPTEPYICSSSPIAVDLSLDPKRRTVLDIHGFDLRSLPITTEVVSLTGRRNVNRALGVISDQRMALDITQSGAALTDRDRRIVFSWANKPQSVIPILSPVTGPTCTTRTQLVTGSPQSFIPPHTRGDKEFAGHGPCVRFWLRILSDPEGSALTANYYMEAFECSDSFTKPRSDYTTARGYGSATLFRVTGPGERILGHNLESSMSWDYIDTDTSDDVYYFTGAEPAEKLVFKSDTSGDDAGVRTGVTIYFREMRVQVETCE